VAESKAAHTPEKVSSLLTSFSDKELAALGLKRQKKKQSTDAMKRTPAPGRGSFV
jgi:hypothetical protein